MKKLIPILPIVFIMNYSCSQSKSFKQQQVAEFQSEMKKINDSSTYYFDIGIKLFKDGKNTLEIIDSIKPKLIYFQAELDKKARDFKITAKKLKLSKNEYDSVFEELNDSFKVNYNKYQFLSKNGITIN